MTEISNLLPGTKYEIHGTMMYRAPGFGAEPTYLHFKIVGTYRNNGGSYLYLDDCVMDVFGHVQKRATSLTIETAGIESIRKME